MRRDLAGAIGPGRRVARRNLLDRLAALGLLLVAPVLSRLRIATTARVILGKDHSAVRRPVPDRARAIRRRGLLRGRNIVDPDAAHPGRRKMTRRDRNTRRLLLRHRHERAHRWSRLPHRASGRRGQRRDSHQCDPADSRIHRRSLLETSSGLGHQKCTESARRAPHGARCANRHLHNILPATPPQVPHPRPSLWADDRRGQRDTASRRTRSPPLAPSAPHRDSRRRAWAP